jgi:hypothetical protein
MTILEAAAQIVSPLSIRLPRIRPGVAQGPAFPAPSETHFS